MLGCTGGQQVAGISCPSLKSPVERRTAAGDAEVRTAGPCCGIPSKRAGTRWVVGLDGWSDLIKCEQEEWPRLGFSFEAEGIRDKASHSRSKLSLFVFNLSKSGGDTAGARADHGGDTAGQIMEATPASPSSSSIFIFYRHGRRTSFPPSRFLSGLRTLPVTASRRCRSFRRASARRRRSRASLSLIPTATCSSSSCQILQRIPSSRRSRAPPRTPSRCSLSLGPSLELRPPAVGGSFHRGFFSFLSKRRVSPWEQLQEGRDPVVSRRRKEDPVVESKKGRSGGRSVNMF
ncbi:hypothetical protein LXL04_015643 [Taraxacum kok-saghyz]